MKGIPKTIRKEIIDYSLDRTKNQNQDSMITLLGARGLAKSTVGLQLQFKYDPGFTLDRVGWDYEEHLNGILGMERGQGYHADEIRFHRMDFRTSLGVEVDKLLNEIRPFNPFSTWCSVRIHKILSTFLEYSHFLFYFYAPGKCVVIKRNDAIMKGNAFGYNDKDIALIKDSRTFNKYFIGPAKKNKLFLGKFIFPRYTRELTPEIYRKYEKIRLDSTRRRFLTPKNKGLKNLDSETRKLIVLKGRSVKVTIEQMATMLEKHPKTIAGDIKKLKQCGELYD